MSSRQSTLAQIAACSCILLVGIASVRPVASVRGVEDNGFFLKIQSQATFHNAYGLGNIFALPSNVQGNLASVKVVVWLAFGAVAVAAFRRWNPAAETGLGLVSVGTVAVFIAYVGLFLAVSFATRWIKDEGPNVIVLVLAVNAAKFVISLLLYRAQDGTFSSLVQQAGLKENWRLAWKYSLLSFFFVVGDDLRLDFIERAGPSAFHVLVNFRVFFLVWIWQMVMNKKLQILNWVGIILICIGCVLKELPGLQDGSNIGSVAHWYVQIELLTLLAVGSGTIVYNEYMLKGANATVNFQNLCLYSSGVMWAAAWWMCRTAFSNSGTIVGNGLTIEEHLRRLVQPKVLLLVALFTALGIVTSYFLKQLSTVTKELATGCEVIASIPLDFLVFGAPFGLMEITAGCLVLVGVLTFASQEMIQVAQK